MIVGYLLSKDLSGDVQNRKSLGVNYYLFLKEMISLRPQCHDHLRQNWSENLVCLRHRILCFWSTCYVEIPCQLFYMCNVLYKCLHIAFQDS